MATKVQSLTMIFAVWMTLCDWSVSQKPRPNQCPNLPKTCQQLKNNQKNLKQAMDEMKLALESQAMIIETLTRDVEQLKRGSRPLPPTPPLPPRPHPPSPPSTLPEIRATLLRNLSVCSHTFGVTQLNRKIYVACNPGETIRVFDSKTFEPLYNITDDNFLDIGDIKACPSENLFFASDYRTRSDPINKSHIVWKSAAGQQLKWEVFIEGLYWPIQLSVATDCRVVLVHNHSRIQIFNSDAELLHDIQWSKQVYQAMLTTSNELIIMGNDANVLEPNTVFKYDIETKTTTQFSKWALVNSRAPLSKPQYIEPYDDGRILVAEMLGRRVVILEADLKQGQVIINDLPTVHRLGYDSATRTLSAGLHSGSVRFYRITETYPKQYLN